MENGDGELGLNASYNDLTSIRGASSIILEILDNDGGDNF